MNRKILLTVLALSVVLLATPLVGMVQAGKGQEKLSIRFEIGGSAADPGREWNSPWWGSVYLGEVNVFHQREVGWDADSTGFLIIVDAGGALEETFDDEEITYSCSYDINLFFNKYPDVGGTIKIRETWEIEGRGYIEILAVEYLHNVLNLPMYEPYWGHGTFVGHGEVDGQKISMSGEAGVVLPDGPFRMGTVMGWPTP